MQSNSDRKFDVLMIDDDKSVLTILSKILQKKGYNVDTAETGRDALTKLQVQKYDVALVDVRLQDMNGLDLLGQIQKIAPCTVKIVLTGYPSDEDKVRALVEGAADYVTKPVGSEKLVAIIEKALEQEAC